MKQILIVMWGLMTLLMALSVQGYTSSLSDAVLKMNFENNVDDLSNSNIEGAFLNGVTPPEYVTGLAGTQSINFNGESYSYVEIPDSDVLDFGTGDFSISIWVKLSEEHGVLEHFFEKIDYLSGTEVPAAVILRHNFNIPSLWINDQNSHIGFFYAADAINENGGFKASRLTNNEWHHLVVTVDRDNDDGVIFYIDGEQTPYTMLGTFETKITEVSGSVSNDAPLRLGADWIQPEYSFNGQMDSLTLFNRVITPFEVKGLYYQPFFE
ncbi:LamG domain-containing protein [Gynuella sp.]|uniref:LamG domain-containing protein n=1 Tax=Gynuella sp. TaxID=2969146 RepID=UPI003D0D9AF4